MNINDLLTKSNVTMTDLSVGFGIPYRTIQDWHLGKRSAPDYIISMIDEAMNRDERIIYVPMICRADDTDPVCGICYTLEAAMAKVKYDYSYLTESEKKKVKSAYIEKRRCPRDDDGEIPYDYCLSDGDALMIEQIEVTFDE